MERANRAAALHKSDDGALASRAELAAARLVGLAFLGKGRLNLSLAEIGLVGFHNTAGAAHRRKLARPHGLANAMRQKPRRLVLNLQHAMKLVGADALLARRHEIDRLQHFRERQMRGLENRADLHSELLAAVGALAKANARLAEVVVLSRDGAAMRADRAFRPQNALKMGKSGGFVVKVWFRQNGHLT
jgi:hypothetical protein